MSIPMNTLSSHSESSFPSLNSSFNSIGDTVGKTIKNAAIGIGVLIGVVLVAPHLLHFFQAPLAAAR